MKTKFIFALALFFFINSCKKQNPDAGLNDPEALSKEEVQFLDDKRSMVDVHLREIILPNGMNVYDFLAEVDPGFLAKWSALPLNWVNDRQLRFSGNSYDNLGPQDSRNLLVAQMTVVARSLVNRNNFKYPSEGENAPSQNGLVYSWGSKDHTVRKAPPGQGTACKEKVYGLDCSGFIYQVFKHSGVSLLSGPANSQRNPEILQNAIKSSIPQLKKIKVEDLGVLNVSNFEDGDIIYWTNSGGIATHIGIVLKKSDGSLGVFQSNGSVGEDAADCSKNLGSTRGARILELGDPYWFGPNKKYGITRINAEVSGKWRLFLRCQGYDSDAIVLDLNFKTTDSNSFEVKGEGTDYDGDHLICTGKVSYNKASNELSGTLLITIAGDPVFYRNDSFTVKLARDETPYFSLTLGNNVDAGCPAEGRLINIESGEMQVRKSQLKSKSTQGFRRSI